MTQNIGFTGKLLNPHSLGFNQQINSIVSNKQTKTNNFISIMYILFIIKNSFILNQTDTTYQKIKYFQDYSSINHPLLTAHLFG